MRTNSRTPLSCYQMSNPQQANGHTHNTSNGTSANAGPAYNLTLQIADGGIAGAPSISRIDDLNTTTDDLAQSLERACSSIIFIVLTRGRNEDLQAAKLKWRGVYEDRLLMRTVSRSMLRNLLVDALNDLQPLVPQQSIEQ